MTEIPEHLVKRAQAARERAASEQDETTPVAQLPHIPEHLLRRSRIAREQAVPPVPAEQEPTDDPGRALDQRLSGIVDMSGEPCSLLAGRVAGITRSIMGEATNSWSTKPTYGVRYDMAERRVRNQRDGSDHSMFVVRKTLAETTKDEPSVITGLEVVQIVKPTYKSSWLGSRAVLKSVEWAKPEQAYIFASVRSDLLFVPVMGIRIGQSSGDCSFVELLGENPNEVGELVVTPDDQSVAEKEVALSTLRALLEHAKESYEPAILHGNSTVFDKIGATKRVQEVMGPLDKTVEGILSLLSYFDNIYNRSIEQSDEVEAGSNHYPAITRVSIEDGEADKTIVRSSLELIDTTNVPVQDIFPRLVVDRTSSYPLQFDGIDPVNDQVQYQQMLADFQQLLLELIEYREESELSYARSPSIYLAGRDKRDIDREDRQNAIDAWETL